MSSSNRPANSKDENLDPITGEPGAHPVGTGLGAAGVGAAGGVAGYAAAGALGGAAGGPVGAAVGAAVGVVVGAVAGGLAGKGIAESIDPTAEEAHWSQNYSSRPYVDKAHDYSHYQPAYQYGVEARSLHADKSWDEIESELEKGWAGRRGQSKLEWGHARHASRDAWDRIGTGGGSISDKV